LYALVIYIPGRLGGFLDELRRELSPDCNPRAHVSILPPRRLSVDWRTARDQARWAGLDWAPFCIEAGQPALFPGTQAVYLELVQGARELREIHAAMNVGAFACDERFEYHPHITLAQGLPLERVDEAFARAVRLWNDWRGERAFTAEMAVFVRHEGGDNWSDLAAIELAQAPIRRFRP
jgi:hypothetical protein